MLSQDERLAEALKMNKARLYSSDCPIIMLTGNI